MVAVAGGIPMIIHHSSVRDTVRQSRCGFSDNFVGFGENVMSASEPAVTAVISRKRETDEFLTNLELTESQWLEALIRHFHPAGLQSRTCCGFHDLPPSVADLMRYYHRMN